MAYLYDITAVQSPRWAHEDQLQINIDVQVSFLGDIWLPFTADPKDVEPRGRYLYQLAIDGAFGEIAPYEAEVSA